MPTTATSAATDINGTRMENTEMDDREARDLIAVAEKEVAKAKATAAAEANVAGKTDTAIADNTNNIDEETEMDDNASNKTNSRSRTTDGDVWEKVLATFNMYLSKLQ